MGEVNLVPPFALPGISGVAMVIVVPLFSREEEAEPPAVSTRVGGLVSSRAREVRERVDEPRCVVQHERRQEEADEQARHPAVQETKGGESNGREHVPSVEPDEFGVDAEGSKRALGLWPGNQEPDDVGPPESTKFRRVWVALLVCFVVMVDVLFAPVQDAPLRARLGEEAQNKL